MSPMNKMLHLSVFQSFASSTLTENPLRQYNQLFVISFANQYVSWTDTLEMYCVCVPSEMLIKTVITRETRLKSMKFKQVPSLSLNIVSITIFGMKKEPNGSIEDAGNDTILKGSQVLNISKYLQSPKLKPSILEKTQLQHVVFGLWPVSERMCMLSIAVCLLPLQGVVVHMSGLPLATDICQEQKCVLSCTEQKKVW